MTTDFTAASIRRIERNLLLKFLLEMSTPDLMWALDEMGFDVTRREPFVVNPTCIETPNSEECEACYNVQNCPATAKTHPDVGTRSDRDDSAER